MIADFIFTRIPLISPLRNKHFALRWTGVTVSIIGNSVYRTSLPFLVLDLGGGAPEISATLVSYFAFQITFSLLGGVVADRFLRLKVLLTTDIVQAGALCIVILNSLANRSDIWQILLLSAVFGTCSAFSQPAARALTPMLVPEGSLLSANALISFSSELSNISGPLLGGFLVSLLGTSVALGFDAFTFLVSAVCLLAILRISDFSQGIQRGHANVPWKRNLRSSFVEGIQIVARSQWLWVTIGLASFSNVLLAGATGVALPLYASERLHGSESYGTILAGTAIGSLLAAAFIGRSQVAGRRGVLAYGGILASGTALVGLGFAAHTWQGALLGALYGCGLMVFGVLWETTLQERVPKEKLGRVASIDTFSAHLLLPIGLVAFGAAVERTGSSTALVIAGAGTVLIALAGLSLRSIRQLQ